MLTALAATTAVVLAPTPAVAATPSVSDTSGTDQAPDPLSGVLQIVSGVGSGLGSTVGSTVGTVLGGLTGATPPTTSTSPGSTPTGTTPPTTKPTGTKTAGSTPPRSTPTGSTPSHPARGPGDHAHGTAGVPDATPSHRSANRGRATTSRLAPTVHHTARRNRRTAPATTHPSSTVPRRSLAGSAPTLGVASPLLQHRDRDLTTLFGPLIRPGRTVLMLMASAIALALLILALLVLVGRRPDPRVAVAADRLRSHITG